MNPSILQQCDVMEFYSMVKCSFENGNPEENACRLAYNDMKRTLRGFGKCERKDVIKSEVQKLLQTELLGLLNDARCLDEDEFDEKHLRICKKMKDVFSDSYTLTFGHAQKWTNMFFKYMYIADERMNGLLPFLHIPIDSIVLDGIERNNFPDKIKQYIPKCRPWSKMDDYNIYIGFQREFRTLFERPLLHEFCLWNKWHKK